MLRNLLAAVLGFIAGWVIFVSIQAIAHQIFMPGIVMNPESQFSMAAYMQRVPTAMHIVVLAGYAIGSLVAGLVIGFLAKHKGSLIPVIIAILFMVLWTLNLVILRYPVWVSVIGYFMFIPFAVLGQSLTSGFGKAAPGQTAELEDQGAEAAEAE